jgi:hypothetical protein
MRKGTLVVSDMHFGDAGQLLESLEDTMRRATLELKEFGGELEVVLNGDAIAGQGIFRDQFCQNLLQFGPEQVAWCAWRIKEWDEILDARWVILRGNHDQDRKSNMAQLLAIMAHLFGTRVQYVERSYLGNFTPDKRPEYWFDAQHGAGYSSYYANSYAEIRNCWAKYIEVARTRGVGLSRFLRGHTHWLNVGQTLGVDVAIDTTGGWHRQERANLSDVPRIPGVILYLWDGKELEIKPLTAERDLVLAETADRKLHYRNMEAAGKALAQVDDWGAARGLWGEEN